VLVFGGALLAAACTGKGKGESARDGTGSASSPRDGGSAPERGGGVSSW
jgi:hypothetical protein